MAESHKKVLVRLRGAEIVAGYLQAGGFVTGQGEQARVQLLDLAGRISAIPLAKIARIAFVRDFNLADTIDPERLSRRTFQTRPRTAGLWIRLQVVGEQEPLEGLAAANVSLLDGLIESAGLFLAPPDTRSNTQRLFIPRAAIVEMQVLAVITNAAKPKVPVDRSTTQKTQSLPFPPPG